MAQILSDIKFENGFELYHVDKLVTDRPVAVFNLKNTAKAYPDWKLAQWCSKYNLANGSETVDQSANYRIADRSKEVTLDTRTGRISLSLTASNEYTAPRREGEGWPHLLIEQEFKTKPKILGGGAIDLTMEFCIDRMTDRHSGDRQELHTAQFSWIFALSDQSGGAGHGDFVWFGCPIYDARYAMPGAFAAQDGGKQENTGKFIYFIDSKNYLSSPVETGKRYGFTLNAAPYMAEALETAKRRGFIRNSRPEDFVLHNTNIGWEVTGTFDAALTLLKISVDA